MKRTQGFNSELIMLYLGLMEKGIFLLVFFKLV